MPARYAELRWLMCAIRADRPIRAAHNRSGLRSRAGARARLAPPCVMGPILFDGLSAIAVWRLRCMVLRIMPPPLECWDRHPPEDRSRLLAFHGDCRCRNCQAQRWLIVAGAATH